MRSAYFAPGAAIGGIHRIERGLAMFRKIGTNAGLKACAPALLLLVLAAGTPAAGQHVDDQGRAAIKSLCVGKDEEGGYDWSFEGEPSRIWVICQGETSVIASINSLDSAYVVTMVHTAISSSNPDILSFATYSLSADGAKTVNGRTKSHSVLRLSIQALRQGLAVGEFQRNPVLPIPVGAARSHTLPNLFVEPPPAFPVEFSGQFYVDEPQLEIVKQHFLDAQIKPPACIVTSVDGDLRTVNFHDSSHQAIWLAWGSSAATGGNVFYSTNGIDDALAGKDTITQIRGVFRTPDLIEFFYFNSFAGMRGPFQASRMDDRMLASNPCRPHL
jgi:hypothetical protein